MTHHHDNGLTAPIGSELQARLRASMFGLARDCGVELAGKDKMPEITDLGAANHPNLSSRTSDEPWYCAGNKKDSLRTSDGNWWDAATESVWDLASTAYSELDDAPDYEDLEEPLSSGDDDQDELDAIQDRHVMRLEEQRAHQRAQRERRNALAAVSTDPLCSVYGFTPEDVIELDVAQRAVVLQTIKLLNELCDLLRALRPAASDQMVTQHVCKLIGWNNEPPKTLTGFDLTFLFEKSSKLADAVALRKQRLQRIREEQRAYAQREQSKSRIAPRRTAQRPRTAQPVAGIPVPANMPTGAGWGGMLEGGTAYKCICCGHVGLSTRMRALPFDVIRGRMGGQRVHAQGLWQHVICHRCDNARPGLRTYQAERQRLKMLESDNAQARRTPQRRRSHKPRMTGGVGGGINRNKRR